MPAEVRRYAPKINSSITALCWRVRGGCGVALFACCFAAVGRPLAAMSPFVFLSADVTFLGPSSLVRFDGGHETFAVDTGMPDTFIGVTSVGGELLVADQTADALQRFSPTGAYLGAFATPGLRPTFLESDLAGNIYATPQGAPIDQPIARRLNSSGTVTQTFIHPELVSLGGIDADADGNVYVADTATKHVYKFAPDGGYLYRISVSPFRPQDVAIDEANQRLYLSASSDGIQVLDISGELPSLTGSIAAPAGAEFHGLHVAADSGNILTTDFGIFSGDPRGIEFSPSGELLAEYRTQSGIEVALDVTTYIPRPGDYNGSGTVGPADYLTWKASYGQTGNHPADGNRDGLVNAADYVVWRQNRIATAAAGAANTSANTVVPEPAAVQIAFACLLLLAAGRTRSKVIRTSAGR